MLQAARASSGCGRLGKPCGRTVSSSLGDPGHLEATRREAQAHVRPLLLARQPHKGKG